MRALVVAVLVLLAGTARADEPLAAEQADSPAGAAFRAATRLIADGDLAGAQVALEEVAALEPGGPWADDALSEAAAVAERRGDLAGAQRLWKRVLDEHPSSRQARRARTKLAALDRAVGEGGRWLDVAVEHEAILRAAVGQSDPTAQVEALIALVAANPDYPRAHDARMWIGDRWQSLGFLDRASATFEEALAATTEPQQRWDATMSLGDVQKVAGRYDAAEATYRGLLGIGDDGAVRQKLRQVDKLRARERLSLVAWIGLGVAVVVLLGCLWRAAGTPRDALRSLIRPPIEVLYYAPVAVVVYLVAATGNRLVLDAVEYILLGGLAVTWLVTASLEARRRRGGVSLGWLAPHLAAAVVAIGAVFYLSIMQGHLPELIAETMTHGHDR